MAKVTWQGEGDEKAETTYFGKQMKVGESVDVDENTPEGKRLLQKAHGNKYMKVEGWEPDDQVDYVRVDRSANQTTAGTPASKESTALPKTTSTAKSSVLPGTQKD